MKEVTAYKTTDGKLFEDYSKAKSYQEDLIGQALDNLVAHDERGNVTQVDRFSFLLATLKDPKLKEKVTVLYNSLGLDCWGDES